MKRRKMGRDNNRRDVLKDSGTAVAALIDGRHMCAMARGVRDTHSTMKVDVMHGVFQSDRACAPSS